MKFIIIEVLDTGFVVTSRDTTVDLNTVIQTADSKATVNREAVEDKTSLAVAVSSQIL